MAKDPAFLFYPKDWLEGTADFTPQEKGVYFDLLCYQHQRGSLPLEPSKLARMVRLSLEEFEIIWKVVKTKFVQADYAWINLRMKEGMIKRGDMARKKRISGIFASLVKKDNLSKELLRDIKKAFSVDFFMQFPDSELQSEITKWYTKWLDFGDVLVNHPANANANANGN